MHVAEVAVIGAGSSGLVAARHLINAGLRPTIYDAAKTIGGAWTPSRGTMTPPSSQTSSSGHPASKMWNGMATNLSKHTCRFSDWPWPDDASTFPPADEMHRYLESYAENFLKTSPSPSCNFQSECKVFDIEQLESQPKGDKNYRVKWVDLNTQSNHSQDFYGVVVATGFFHTPRFPSFLNPGTGSERNKSTGNNKPHVIHSSEYESHQQYAGKHVAVIGSSFSAFEICADIARSASRVVNVAPSIPWVLPRWIPTMQTDIGGRSTTTILPADLVLYQRMRPFPQTPEKISLTNEDCRKRHKYLLSLVGHKQRHSPLGEPTNWEEPPFVAISDEYLDLVREDKIEVVHGRLVGLDEDGSLRVRNDKQCASISVDRIICCTGYTSQLHEFLSPKILSTLKYDQADTFSPITLAWDTLHPSLPNLAFCGMYRGPHMGIMELQARLAAGAMSGSLSFEKDQFQLALKHSERIRNSDPRAQFPHFDYIGLMDTLTLLCSRGGYPKYNTEKGDIVVPGVYQPDKKLAQKCQSEIQQDILHGQDGSRMPEVVLRSILGKWSFDRQILHMQTRKVEHVHGAATLSKYWERPGLDNHDDGDKDENCCLDIEDKPVLYREDGLYELTPTQKFPVFKEYEYECKQDALEIFSVESGKRTNLFLSLKFVPEMTSTQTSSSDGFWLKATADHLCIKDLYSATFRVKLNGLSASEMIIKYRVKGPAKDYESTTILKPWATN